jgi:hypothetical protein
LELDDVALQRHQIVIRPEVARQAWTLYHTLPAFISSARILMAPYIFSIAPFAPSSARVKQDPRDPTIVPSDVCEQRQGVMLQAKKHSRTSEVWEIKAAPREFQ